MDNSPGPMVQHLAINVRDIEASHRFYTEALGFQLCGNLRPPPGLESIDMRFYRGDESRHHDLALVQAPDPSAFSPVEARWMMFANRVGINHIAIRYPDREAFLARLAHLRAMGVNFEMRGSHGMTHSLYVTDPDGNGVEVLYDVPQEAWEGDVDAALSFWDPVPMDGHAELQDSTDYKRF